MWRASSDPSAINGGLADLLGFAVGKCNTSEPTVTLTFFDEDENTVTQGVCPSPCTQPTFNFPLETQRSSITAFSHPNWPAGWVSMEFFNATGPVGGSPGSGVRDVRLPGRDSFLSAGMPAAQLDPTNCQPLLVPALAADRHLLRSIRLRWRDAVGARHSADRGHWPCCFLGWAGRKSRPLFLWSEWSFRRKVAPLKQRINWLVAPGPFSDS